MLWRSATPTCSSRCSSAMGMISVDTYGIVADTGVIIFFGYLVDCYVILVVLSLGYGGVMRRGEAAVGWRRQQQLDARSSLQCCSVIAAHWLDCLGCTQAAEIIFHF